MGIWTGLLLTAAGGLVLNDAVLHDYEMRERKVVVGKAIAYAQSVNKPSLIVGTTKGRHQCGDVTLDTDPSVLTDCPLAGMVGSIYDLSALYRPKHFGSVAIMHVLEHLEQPEEGLRQAMIVGERVYIAGPALTKLVSWLHPDHRAMGWWAQFKKIFRCANCNAEIPYLAEQIQCEGCGARLTYSHSMPSIY